MTAVCEVCQAPTSRKRKSCSDWCAARLRETNRPDANTGVPYEDVLAIADTNGRQLGWWIRDGLIPGQPAEVGSGNRRTWTRDQVRFARVLRLIGETGMVPFERVVAEALTDADWSEPLTVRLTTVISVTFDLPAIDREIPTFEENQ